MRDLRFALRQLLKRPGFTATAVVTLALGLGATTAIFTVVRGVLLRDLPYPDPHSLVLVWRGGTEDPGQRGPLSPPDVVDVTEMATSFTGVAAVNSFSTNFVGDDGEPEQIQLGVVTGDFFRVLGVGPMLGRVLEPGDDRPIDTRNPAAVGLIVLDHAFWMRRFAGDSAVLGRTIRVGGGGMRVLGVLPPGFRLHMPAGAGMSTTLAGWTPLGIDARAAPRDGAYLKVLARLRNGVTAAQARAELDGISARLRALFPPHADAGFRLRVVPLQRDVVAHVRPVLLLLATAGAVVLLVACANTGVLLLVRILGRRQEFAIRAALGAGRPRLIRQLLLEAGLVTAIGAAVGALLAAPAVRALLRLEPGIVPRTGDIGVDGTVWLAALALAAGAALLCGLGPALLITRGAWSRLLPSRAGIRPGARRIRRGLVVAQVAASFALLYGSASLLGTLVRLQRADLGFRAGGAESFRATLPFAEYRGPDAWIAFFDRLADNLGEHPAIGAAALTSDLPMAGGGAPEPYVPTERAGDVPWGSRTALHRIVSPGYYGVVGIALRQGRDFTPADREGGSRVAVIDEALATRLLHERAGPVLGRRLDVTAHEFRAGYQVVRTTVEVVGVVGVVPEEHPDAVPPGTIYLPLAQHPLWSMAVIVRPGPGGPAGTSPLGASREVLGRMNPGLPLVQARPLQAVVDQVLAPTRFLLALTGLFGIIAIGLTAAGLYGLVAETVRQRRKELGIRLAMGAVPLTLARRVLLGGLVLAAMGMLPGLALAPAAGRIIARAVLVPPGVNLTALAVAAALLLAVAAAACYIPARRAATVDPTEALHDD